MNQNELEDIANDYFNRAIDAKKQGDIEEARENFSICWGFNNFLHEKFRGKDLNYRTEFMYLCSALLGNLHLTVEGVRMFEIRGYRQIQKAMAYVDEVEKRFREE